MREDASYLAVTRIRSKYSIYYIVVSDLLLIHSDQPHKSLHDIPSNNALYIQRFDEPNQIYKTGTDTSVFN